MAGGLGLVLAAQGRAGALLEQPDGEDRRRRRQAPAGRGDAGGARGGPDLGRPRRRNLGPAGQGGGQGPFGREVTDTEVREALAAAIAEELEPVAEPLPHRARFRPQVVLVCGVNGTGKTTTIGKLANQAVGAGLKVVLAACDTFRAAAVEQLEVWGRRNGVPVIRGQGGRGPGRARLRRARARPRRGRGPADDRHRRAAAEQAGADGRAAQDRPGAEEGRPRGAARRGPRARRHDRPERAQPGRGVQGPGRA